MDGRGTATSEVGRIARAALVAIVALTTAGGLAAKAEAATATSSEREVLDRTNADRAANSRPSLQYDPLASDVARAWSQHLAATGNLAHNPGLVDRVNAEVTSQWTRLGENVGYGGSIDSIQRAFMNSSGHRANILGDYNRVGIGATQSGDGRWWVTVVFVKGPALAAPAGPPISPGGSFDAAHVALNGFVTVTGWAIDPDTTAPIDVHVWVDGAGGYPMQANAHRPDIGTAYPGYGNAHGFSGTIPMGNGQHQLCAYAINIGPGSNSPLGCRTVVVDTSPRGSLDGVVAIPGGVIAVGWAADPETGNPVQVHVLIDGAGGSFDAGADRPDLSAVLPGLGTRHGYTGLLPAGPGSHQVCAYGINVGAGSNRLLGCRTVVIGGDPLGSADLITPSGGGVRVAGWAFDPNSSSAVHIHVYVDGRGYDVGTAGIGRGDIGGIFPWWGPDRGFDAVVPVGAGQHQVCVYALNLGGGSNARLGCRTVVG